MGGPAHGARCLLTFFLILLLLQPPTCLGDATPWVARLLDYPTNSELVNWKNDFLTRCHIASFFPYGTSIQGTTLWALTLTALDPPNLPRPLKAHVRYVGNLHGDEPLSRVLLPALAEYLCTAWNVSHPSPEPTRKVEKGAEDPTLHHAPSSSSTPSPATPSPTPLSSPSEYPNPGLAASFSNLDLDQALTLLASTRLTLIISANPDGFAASPRPTRGNAHGQDLNRNFPDPVHEGVRPDSRDFFTAGNTSLDVTHEQAQEVKALMKLGLSHRYTGSLSLHEGAVVAVYGWDGHGDGREFSSAPGGKEEHVPSRTPDDDTLRYLAESYARLHTTMADSQLRDSEFTRFKLDYRGAINGAEWYPLYGGMSDLMYIKADCPEVTLELSLQKMPNKSTLSDLWDQNRVALVGYAVQLASRGLLVRAVEKKGEGEARLGVDEDQDVDRPTARYSGVVANAVVYVHGIDKVMTTRNDGSLLRPLVPGVYQITMASPCHETRTWQQVVVAADAPSHLDAVLTPCPLL